MRSSRSTTGQRSTACSSAARTRSRGSRRGTNDALDAARGHAPTDGGRAPGDRHGRECRGADGDHRTGDRRRRNHRHRHRDGQPGRCRDDAGTSSTARPPRYGSSSASASAGSGTANAAVSVPLTGLAQGTTYHYRVVATSTSGTSHGSDGLFTTLAAPGAVTGSASSIAVSSATLNGSVDPNATATTWWFDYGTSTSYGSKTTGQERRQRHRAGLRLRAASRACRPAAPTTSGWSR